MIIYLNELSFEGGNGLIADWQKVKDFDVLLQDLLAVSNVTIIAPKNIWDMPIGGFDVRRKQMVDGSKVKPAYGMFLSGIFGKFKPIVEGWPLFSLNEEMTKPSSSIGMAVIKNRPVVSVTFDERFANEHIDGWFQNKLYDTVVSTNVRNIFDGVSRIQYSFLADMSSCRQKNPVKEPMWNQKLAAKIIDTGDLIHLSRDERREKLIYFGHIIADINGWVLNKDISRLNTTNGHNRYIFDSHRYFTSYETAYLSIDLEGPDVCYELCDKKGHHLGQVSWDNKWKGPKEDHGIRVR